MKNSTKFLSFNCAEMDYLPDSNLCKLSNFGNQNGANCMPNLLNRTKMGMILLIFFLFSTSVRTFSQNLLSNSGFDSGTTGWSASPVGSIFTFSGQYAYSGNSLTLNNNDYWGNYYTWQTISATAGIKYNISFMASTHNPVYYAAVGYEFYNSLGLIIGSRVEKRVTGSVYNSSGYSKYEFLGVTAPAGTAKLRVVGYTNGTALKIDNISVSLTSTCSNVTSGGTIGSNQTGCSGFDPVAFTSVTAPSGGAGTLEIIWMKSTTSSVLNTTTQSQWSIIPGATGLTYDAGPITQTTYFTRCSRRAGCTAYVGEANVITATVNANCQGKDPVCLSRKSSVLSSSLCSDATKSYGLWFNDLKGNVACPSQYFTVKSGELTEFCDGTAVLNIVGCVTGGGASDCITATVNYSGRTGTPPAGSPLTNTHCSGYAPNVGNWYYYPTSNGTFSGTGIFAGLAGTYTQNMAAFQVGTGGSLNDISKFGASSWFKINLTSGGTNNWTTASKDGDININLGTATHIASVTATANPNAICKGSNVVLTATLDAASKSANCSPTYSWVGSNGFTSTQATVTNTSVQAATTYTVTVTFTAKNGSKCSVTGTTAVALSANCCDNVTNGGQIGGNQRNCGAFDPAAFTNVTLPSGGTGTLEYLWLKSTTASTYTDANASEWIPIVGSNSATLDLNNISQTTYFQRCSRRAGCTDYVGETNVVSVIIDPLPTAPTVTPASICGTGTVTLGATCGTGTTAMWYSALTVGTSISSGASFTTPSLSATTTYYVSCKSSAGCESGRTSVVATVTPKITDGGKIQADETICIGSTPSKITSVTLPNGGVGSIEYLWLQTTSLTNGVCPANIAGQTLYSPIANTNTSEYQPGAITTTTCYIRCSRLAGCTDYTGESNVIKKTVGSIGVAPTVTPASICGTGTVTLGATCATGTTAMWYSALTGGTSIGSGASFTTPSLTATTTYYVSCKSSAGCESGRTSVVATVTPKITDGGKIQADETICTGSTPSKITSVSLPNGGLGSIEYLWLQTTSLTNGVCPANIAGQTLYSPISNSNGSEYQPGAITTTTCYIRCSRLTGCTDYTGESNVIKKTVGSIGVAPTVTAGSICGTGTVTLGATCATGTTAMWYSALTGGTSIASGASFTTPSLSATTTYYVSCKSSAGCESGRTSVVATVVPKITDGGKIQADETICTGSTPSKITNVTLPNGGAGSIEYLWLQTTSLTNGVCPSNIAGQTLYSPIANTNTSEYQPGAITQTTCYIRCSRLAGCTDYTGESNAVKKTVGSIGVAPTVTAGTVCGTGTVTLGATCATATTAMWYSALTGGISIASGASFTTPSLSATTTYYVSCKSSAGCESARTAVVATVNGGATSPTVTPASICGTGTVTLGATCATGATAMWYSASTGGTSIASGATYTTPSLSATTTYYVSCKSIAGCESGRTSVVATINGSLSGPSAIKNGTICGNGTVELGAVCTTGTPMWYATATGGTSFTTGSVYVTPVLTATTSYYVSCKSTAGCESARIEVKATVIAKITNGGTIQADETLCGSGIPTQIISVTPASGGDVNAVIEYVWLQTTTLSNGACPLNIVGQNLYTEIPNTNTPNYQPGAITQTTCYIRCSRRAGCTDYIGGESNTVKKTVGSASAAPTVTSGSICGTGTVTLGATCSTGATAMWYSASTGGTSIANGASFTTPSLSASITYYVSCKSSAGCESARTPVIATVNGSASAPTVTPATTCGAGSVTLGATCSAGVATWYSSSTGGTAIASGATYTTPSLTATTTYYVSCKAGTGCESPRVEVKATVIAKITNGGTIKADETLCGSGTPAKMTNVTLPSGGDVNAAIEYVWLQTTTLSNGACPLNIVGQNLYTEIPNSNTADYQPGAITQTTCYIRCSRRAGCTDYIGGESNTVKKTVGSASVAPTVTPASICGTGTVTLGATCSTGATAMWYSASTGGTSIASGATYTTPSLTSTTTYYVSCKSSAGCESARTAVTATVNGSASAPTVTPATTCGAGSVTLGATCSAGVATWYSSSTGGTAIASGATYTTSSLTATTTYYVSCKAGTGCESPRVEVKATVIAKITNGGTIKADETLCGSGTPAKMTNVTLPSGGDVNAAIEYVWLQTTTLSNGACPLNIVGQNLYTEIPNSNTADYQPGAITQTTCYIRCSRRAGCTDYIGGESNTVKKTVTTPFTVTPSTNANAVCAGTTVSITLSTTATGTVSYSWTGPNGFTANSKDVVITNASVANSGVYTVSVSNGTGCTAVATANVKITNCLKLGDSVFNDKNNNGKQDADEVGISGVSVKLYDNANNLVGTATTDVNGKYLFSNLAPGDYVVEIVAPTGYKSSTGTVGSATGSAEPAVDPDNNVDGDDNGTTVSGQTIRTKPVTLTVVGGDNLTVDFGLFKPAQIGDYVFRDSNGDGKQDAGEGGVSGVTVKLYDSANNVIATTTTDANGKYVFDNLIAGNYTVEFVKSTIGSGFSFSPKGATTSDKDSDADLTTGKTATITLTEGQVNKDIDAGVTTPCDTDTTPPVLSACPADIIIKTRGTSATITWTEPTATDNCGTVVLTSTSTSGSQFPVGTTTVTYTATDAKGNKATCSFVVNVVKIVTCDVDTQAPVFYDCPTDISVVTTGTSAVVLWDHPAVGDNCGIPNITYNFEPGMSFPVGVTTVTYKAVDAKGNTSYCSFKVTVTKKITTSTLTNAAARVAVAEDVTFADNVTIYPNPSSSDCSIELSAELMRANKSVEVSILSTAGNVEFSQTATGTERTSVKVPVENMPSGTYFVNVGLENGRVIIKKLQIVK